MRPVERGLFRRRQFHRASARCRELLPHLVEWQKRNHYPLSFACEATLNIAKRPEILSLMREAMFETIFCGIETTDADALEGDGQRSQQHGGPILEAIETLNGYGMEVVSGIIVGLDTDTQDSCRRLLEFVDTARRFRCSPRTCCKRCRARRCGTGSRTSNGSIERRRSAVKSNRRVPAAV